MDTWFISDTHFGHANIIRYSNRPFTDVVQMNEAMIKSWNELVKPDDEVWHLGDFAFMPFAKFNVLCKRLNGKINVVLGNHDAVIENNRMISFDPTGEHYAFSSVQHYKELKAGGKFIVLHHYGQRVWNKSHHGSIHLYGHSHGSLPPHGLSVDVGVDCKEITPDYRPIHIDEVVSYMAKRVPQVVDHHDTR